MKLNIRKTRYFYFSRKAEMLNYWYKILDSHTAILTLLKMLECLLVRIFVFIIMLTEFLFSEGSNYSV
jgi:hypothetical protein